MQQPMIHKYWIITAFAIFIIAFSHFGITKHIKINRLKTEVKQIRREFGEAVSNIYDLEQSLILGYENDFFSLDEKLIVQTQNHHSILLKDLIQGNTLIFRFSTASCMTCVKETTDILNQYFAHKDWRIVVLSNYEDLDNIKFIQEYLNIKQDIYCIKDLGLPIDKKHVPYLFIADNNLRVGMLFSPLRKFPDLTMKYIHCILSKPLFN